MIFVQLFIIFMIIFIINFGLSFVEPDESFKERLIISAKVSLGFFLVLSGIVGSIFLLSLTC